MRDYSISDKIKYYSNLAKKGAKDKNGNFLSDFQRGVCFGKARMLSYCAGKFNKQKKSCKQTDVNTRTYSDEELNSLFDNLSVIDID